MRAHLAVPFLALAVAVSAAADSMTVERRSGRDWRDGTFLGDGQTGVIAYAPMHLEWLVNRNDVIDGRRRLDHRITHAEVVQRVESSPTTRNSMVLEEADGCNGRHCHFETISAAILRLRFWGGLGWSAPAAPEVSESMSLRDGELAQSVVSGAMDIRVSTCVLREADVVAFSISGAEGRRVILELSRPEHPGLESMRWLSRDKELKLFTQKLPDGNVYAVALASKGNDHVLAVRTTRECGDPASAARAAAEGTLGRGYAALAAANRAWWNGFWERGGNVRFESEPEVDLAWHQCLFAMAASYGKPPMPGLNGLVYGPVGPTAPGISFPDYTHDQNVQIPMFAFNPVNHCEFVRSFSGTYERIRKVLEENTRQLFGTEGICLPLAINPDGYENPTGSYRYSLCGAAYSALVLAQAWRYSRDKAILADTYPLLRDLVLFNLALMKKGADGLYRLDWMVPPEIFRMTRDELCAIACLRTSLETLVEASELLGRDADRRAHWRDVLAHYPRLVKQSEGGWWCGPDIPDDHEMWGGHLFYPFYPAECAIGAADRETALRTVDYLYRYGLDMSYFSREPHPKHDWTAYYLAVTRLRLRPREEGWREVKEYLRLFRKPNGFFTHNAIVHELDLAAARAGYAKAPRRVRRRWDDTMCALDGMSNDVTPNPDAKRLAAPVIEGFGAFLFIATESLLQSWDGEIRVFPGVPPNFTGSFTNLLAKGGCLVSAEMKDGRLVSKTIRRKEQDK